MVAAGGNHSYLNIRVRSHHKLRTDMLSHVQALRTDMFSHVQVRCGHERARGKRRVCGSLSSLALAPLSLSLFIPSLNLSRWGIEAANHPALPRGLWCSTASRCCTAKSLALGYGRLVRPNSLGILCPWGNSVRPLAWDAPLQSDILEFAGGDTALLCQSLSCLGRPVAGSDRISLSFVGVCSSGAL